MTNDHDKVTADRSVSATYRELADESAPAGLDEQILRRAAALPRARSGIGSAWMKPVAWVATIGLSLAIVLELTQIPQAPLDVNLLDVDTVAPPTDERPAMAPASGEPATAKESRITKPSKHRSESGAVEESAAQAMAPALPDAKVHAEIQAPADTATPAPEPAQPQVLEAPDLQRLDDGDIAPDARSDEVAGTAAFAIRAKRMMPEQPALCPETVRKVAEDWYRCIEAQRNDVSAPRVAREFKEFRNRFPDFQLSDTE